MAIAIGIGLAIIAGALLFVSVAAAIASILIIVYSGPIWASLLAGVIGILAGIGANAAGIDPIFGSLLRLVIGAGIASTVLFTSPLILSATLSLLLGIVLQLLALEISIILAVR